MDRPGPRSRRLVNYGTARRSHPRTNIASERILPTGNSNQDTALPHKSNRSHLLHTKVLGSKNGEVQSRGSPGATRASAVTRRRPPLEDDVYDFPCSDDEKKTYIAPRKRKRQFVEGKAIYHDLHQEASSAVSMATTRTPNISKTPPPNTVDSEDRVSLPQRRKSTRDPKQPWAPRREKGQPAIGTSRTCPTAHRSSTPHRQSVDHSTSADSEIFGVLSSEVKLARYTGADVVRTPTSSPSRGSRPAGNTTPGRRRLIDSLGLREQSINESSSVSPAARQQPPQLILRTPVQPVDRVPSNVRSTDRHGENQSQDSTVSLSSNLCGSKVTYARQRSFLDDLALSSELSTQKPSAGFEQGGNPDRLNTGDRSRAHLLIMDEETNDDGSVRSIHELRQAGGNARFRGAVESIFEDIEDAHISTSSRCNAFVQICAKLLDPKLSHRFVECGFDKRLVDCLSNDLGIVCATFAFCAYELGFSGETPPYVLATDAWPKLLNMSPMLLSVHDDLSAVAQAKAHALSRAVQKSVQNVIPQMASTLFHETPLSTLSPCLLALRCLKSTISTFQAKGESIKGLSSSLLNELIHLLLCDNRTRTAHTIPSPESSYLLSLAFSILEAHTASAESLTEESRKLLAPIAELYGLLYLNADSNAASQQIQTLYIRVILNVTNNSPSLCDGFATREMVGGLIEIVMAKFGDLTEDALAKENNSLDTVILALGALINLTEQSEASRALFVTPARSSKSFLNRLLRLFLAHVDSISSVS